MGDALIASSSAGSPEMMRKTALLKWDSIAILGSIVSMGRRPTEEERRSNRLGWLHRQNGRGPTFMADLSTLLKTAGLKRIPFFLIRECQSLEHSRTGKKSTIDHKENEHDAGCLRLESRLLSTPHEKFTSNGRKRGMLHRGINYQGST